jgi:hypothetical protein
MAHSKSFPSLKLPATLYHAQVQRDRLGDHFLPKGIERYKQTVSDLAGMPVVGAMGDPGYNPDRFAPVGSLETDIR